MHSVSDRLQICEFALIKADNPFHFFYFLYITKEQESTTEIVKDDCGHKYHPGSKVICGKKVEIFKEHTTLTKYYVHQQKAAVLSYSVIGLCPGLCLMTRFLHEKEINFRLLNQTMLKRTSQ